MADEMDGVGEYSGSVSECIETQYQAPGIAMAKGYAFKGPIPLIY